MKKLIFILLLSPFFVWAQQKHTVGPKETLFSIGRQYNVHPRELAEYNHIPFETGLVIGQVLIIPEKKSMAPLAPTAVLTAPAANNVEIKKTTPIADPVIPAEKQVVAVLEKKSDPAALVPIYHKVQKKENLFQISQQYNKVSIDNLKKWNNLTSDALSEGMNLIVGYEDNSKENVATATATPALIVNAELLSPKKINEPAVQEVIKTTPPVPIVKITSEGFFKNAYTSKKGLKNRENQAVGMASSFKSTSGWEDGKYYCLHNTAPAGSVLKITNNNTKEVIYAKVLDVIPDLKQNEGIVICISNAAASAMGSKIETFEVTINY